MTILNQNMDLEKLYPIVEIFHSVQGEGFTQECHQYSLDLEVVI